jgi:hypothetical protein
VESVWSADELSVLTNPLFEELLEEMDCDWDDMELEIQRAAERVSPGHPVICSNAPGLCENPIAIRLNDIFAFIDKKRKRPPEPRCVVCHPVVRESYPEWMIDNVFDDE